MKYILASLFAVGILAACDTRDVLDPDGEAAPGADIPIAGDETAADSIERYEQIDGKGGGIAEAIVYDDDNVTFSVDNLGFDGTNEYEVGVAVATLGTLGIFDVFDGESIILDDLTGNPIAQFVHRAVAGRSASGDTMFAIVRTGRYVDYGFGGFVFARNGSVTLPITGQAAYNGEYAGIRIFTNQTGLEFTEGDVFIGIDFEDFNDGNAVQGQIFNRVAYDINGNVLATADNVNQFLLTHLPTINFLVGPGVMATNGVLEGELASYALDDKGVLQVFESGKYYGIISGDDAEEIVGVFVVESGDPRFPDGGVTVQETGGFIVYR